MFSVSIKSFNNSFLTVTGNVKTYPLVDFLIINSRLTDHASPSVVHTTLSRLLSSVRAGVYSTHVQCLYSDICYDTGVQTNWRGWVD